MTHNYTAKPSIFMNSVVLSGAFAMSMIALWSTVSLLIGN